MQRLAVATIVALIVFFVFQITTYKPGTRRAETVPVFEHIEEPAPAIPLKVERSKRVRRSEPTEQIEHEPIERAKVLQLNPGMSEALQSLEDAALIIGDRLAKVRPPGPYEEMDLTEDERQQIDDLSDEWLENKLTYEEYKQALAESLGEERAREYGQRAAESGRTLSKRMVYGED